MTIKRKPGRPKLPTSEKCEQVYFMLQKKHIKKLGINKVQSIAVNAVIAESERIGEQSKNHNSKD